MSKEEMSWSLLLWNTFESRILILNNMTKNRLDPCCYGIPSNQMKDKFFAGLRIVSWSLLLWNTFESYVKPLNIKKLWSLDPCCYGIPSNQFLNIQIVMRKRSWSLLLWNTFESNNMNGSIETRFKSWSLLLLNTFESHLIYSVCIQRSSLDPCCYGIPSNLLFI